MSIQKVISAMVVFVWVIAGWEYYAFNRQPTVSDMIRLSLSTTSQYDIFHPSFPEIMF